IIGPEVNPKTLSDLRVFVVQSTPCCLMNSFIIRALFPAFVGSCLNAAEFPVPTLDLSTQTHRQVVVDREPGQYLGHPTTVLLEAGRTVVCVYPKGHGRGAIVLKRSTEGGLPWSERLPTPESWATSRETPTIHRVIDAAGKKRLILWSGLHPARMAVSEDDG